MSRQLKPGKRSVNSRPVATTAALVMACVVTLIGVARGLEPDVILVRCLVAGIATGLGAAFVMAVLTLASNQTQK